MSIPSPAFVLGAPRSGTTLLRVMLEGHSGLFAPPEMLLAPYEHMSERKKAVDQRFWEKGGLRRALMELRGLDVESAKQAVRELESRSVLEVYQLLQQEVSPRILVDKCPHLGRPDGSLERLLTWFPEARFVWIVRNPASVIRSVQNMPMAEVMLGGIAPNLVWEVMNLRIQKFLSDHVDPSRWTMVRYEDLIAEPTPALKRIAAALDVAFEPSMATPYQGDRMRTGPAGARAIGDPNMAGRGKIDPSLADKWLAGFDHRTATPETKALATQFGYDLESIPLPGVTQVDTALQSVWDTAQSMFGRLNLPQDLDALEGRRFLARMVAASIDQMTELNDTDYPVFHHGESATRKMFADNPDTDYHRAVIDCSDGQTYRVTGRVPPETTYVGLLLYGRGGRIGNRLVDDALQTDESGNFVVYVGQENPHRPDGVWLKADGDERAIFVRQYFLDRSTQAPITLSIERLDAPAPQPLTVAGYAKGLQRAKRMLEAVFTRTEQAYQMATGAALNRFIQIPGETLFPTPDNTYQVCWYRFGRDQVMVVRGRLPKSRYFSLSLCNAWMESLDYLRHTVSLNHQELTTDDDGNFEVLLSHRPFPHPNRLDTTGHHAGYLLVRSLLLEGEPADLSIRVMYESEWEALNAEA